MFHTFRGFRLLQHLHAWVAYSRQNSGSTLCRGWVTFTIDKIAEDVTTSRIVILMCCQGCSLQSRQHLKAPGGTAPFQNSSNHSTVFMKSSRRCRSSTEKEQKPEHRNTISWLNWNRNQTKIFDALLEMEHNWTERHVPLIGSKSDSALFAKDWGMRDKLLLTPRNTKFGFRVSVIWYVCIYTTF